MQRHDSEYELHIARRDGKTIQRHMRPHPVQVSLDLDDRKRVDEVVGQHYPRLAGHAAGRTVHSSMQIKQMRDWLPDFQCEIWRTWGNPQEPELVSFSTKGWND